MDECRYEPMCICCVCMVAHVVDSLNLPHKMFLFLFIKLDVQYANHIHQWRISLSGHCSEALKSEKYNVFKVENR